MSNSNPYRPGVGKAPPYLADREQQMKRFQKYVRDFPENQRNVRVTGLRGVGKTVLLREYRRHLRDKDWVVIRRDCTKRFQDEGAFAIAIAEDLQKALEELSVGAKVKRLLGDARTAIGEITVDVAGGVVGVGVGQKGQAAPRILEDRLRDAMLKIGQLAASRGKGVAFLFDEAHVVFDQDGQGGRGGNFPLSALLAAFVEAQDFEDEQLPVMLVVCGLPPLVTNLQAARSHSERLFKAEVIENLSLDAKDGESSPAVVALTKPAEGTGIEFDPGTAARIAGDVVGYPYFIQWYGEALWDAADDAGVPNIDDALYDATKETIQDGLDVEFFDGRYNDARRAEQAVLRVAGSLGGETFTTADLLKEYATKDHRAVRTKLTRLVGDNLIYSIKYGEYGYTAPLFGDYLRRKHPRQKDDS